MFNDTTRYVTGKYDRNVDIMITAITVAADQNGMAIVVTKTMAEIEVVTVETGAIMVATEAIMDMATVMAITKL
jgi:hypothetical protein